MLSMASYAGSTQKADKMLHIHFGLKPALFAKVSGQHLVKMRIYWIVDDQQ